MNCPEDTRSANEKAALGANNAETLAETLGMDQKCERAAESLAEASASSGGFQMSTEVAVGPFGICGSVSNQVAKNWADSQTTSSQSFEEKGCTQMVLNLNSMVEKSRNVNCFLQKNSNTTISVAKSVAQINLEGVPVEKVLANLTRTYETLLKLAGRADDNERALMFMDRADRLLDSIDAHGSVDISNSTLSVSSNVSLKTISTMTTESVEEIVNDYESVAVAAAENTARQNSGTMALTDDARTLIQSEVRRDIENEKTTIRDTINSTTAESRGDAGITIRGIGVRIANSTLSAESIIDMTTTAVLQSAAQFGQRIATKLAADSSTFNSRDSEQGGQERVIDSMNEGNANTIEAGQDAFTDKDVSLGLKGILGAGGGMPLAVVGGVVAVVLLGGRGGGGGSSGSSGPTVVVAGGGGGGEGGTATVVEGGSATRKRSYVTIALGMLVAVIAARGLVAFFRCSDEPVEETYSHKNVGLGLAAGSLLLLALRLLPPTRFVASYVPLVPLVGGLGIGSALIVTSESHSASMRSCTEKHRTLVVLQLLGGLVAGIVLIGYGANLKIAIA